MSDDVAGAFAKLATFEGFAAFGSPVSPILCFLAHQDMFGAIDRACAAEQNKFSLWVDDITVSGARVTGELMYEIRRLIEAKGFYVHKCKWRQATCGMVITGSHVSESAIAPSNKHHVKMREGLSRLDSTTDEVARLSLVHSLLGMTANALGIYRADSGAYQRAMKRRQWLHAERRRLELAIENVRAPAHSKEIVASTELPW
jgi:RNA-directed DNA polymerase